MKNFITPMIAVSSSSIAEVGYNVQAQKLFVTFKNGGKYEYNNVPEALFLQMLTPARTEDSAGNITYIARSLGKFLSAQVKGKFTYAKLN